MVAAAGLEAEYLQPSWWRIPLGASQECSKRVFVVRLHRFRNLVTFKPFWCILTQKYFATDGHFIMMYIFISTFDSRIWLAQECHSKNIANIRASRNTGFLVLIFGNGQRCSYNVIACWGQVSHLYASVNVSIIGSSSDLWSMRRQAIAWFNDDKLS